MRLSSFFVSSILVPMILSGLTVSAHALLQDNGDGTITQLRNDSSKLLWLQDANTTGEMDFFAAYDWINALSYAGYDDWRLPSSLNSDGSGPCGFAVNCTDSEMGYMYYIELGNTAGAGGFTNMGDFQNLQPDAYWSETLFDTDPDLHWVFVFRDGGQTVDDTISINYAWAVRDCPECTIAVVPEPISSTLFIVGGATLGFRRFRKKFKK